MKRENYSFPLERFITAERFQYIKDFSADKETPFLVIDLERIKNRYNEISELFPYGKIYYAVKANPDNEVISMLASQGSYFDVASRYELDQVLGLGVYPDRISYGNTIKKRKDISYFYEKGVRLFVCDAEEDLQDLIELAPGAKVFFRLYSEGTGSDWPLSRKFGTHPDSIMSMIENAKTGGLIPYGISFHVGSQQRDLGQWDEAIIRCKYIFNQMDRKGIKLRMINLGGGFPATYVDPALPAAIYAREIKRYLYENFGTNIPEILLEPGRSITGDSGVIVSEIIQIARKARANLYRWVYLDIGMFGGLIETLGESIKYPIHFDGEGEIEEVILAGPTCDSMDILYENYKYRMPETMKSGDRVYIFSTGAYTQSYSSVAFNGFPPLTVYTI